MAINPMQRKANNSFLLGIVITLLITGVIIGLLIWQLAEVKKEMNTMQEQMVKVYTLNQDIKSGEIIDESMFTEQEINSQTIPANAITVASDLENYRLCDKEGNEIQVYLIDSQTGEQSYEFKYRIKFQDETTKDLFMDEQTGKFYYEIYGSNNIKQNIYVDFFEQPLIAKVDINANTLLTESMIKRGELLTDDIRVQEYNVITLPTQLTTGDSIDIRLRLPDGQDYIVLSNKKVTIPLIEGVDSASCIWMEMSELETLTMSNAIVEAYKINGSKLYATKYVEAGIQDAAETTYIPNDQVVALIATDPNIIASAKNALYNRMNSKIIAGNQEVGKTQDIIRNPINSEVNNEDADDNLQSGVEEEIQSLQEEREKYLESLGM